MNKLRIYAFLMLFVIISSATVLGSVRDQDSIQLFAISTDDDISDNDITAPSATNSSFTLDKNTILSNNMHASTINSDETLTYIIVSEPNHGTLMHSNTNSSSFSYSPDLNYVGTDSFTFKVNNGTTDSNIATVRFNIEEVEEPVIPFHYMDMQNHWANYSASHLAARGLIIGEEIGNRYYFYPDREMTRAEFMLFLLAVTESNEDANIEISNISFADNSSIPTWILDAAKLAYSKGIIKGSASGNKVYLKPNDKISKLEAVVMVNNVLKLSDSTKDLSYGDKGSIASWGMQAAKNLTSYEIVQGNSSKQFNPNKSITRGEAAEIVFKLVKQLDAEALKVELEVK